MIQLNKVQQVGLCAGLVFTLILEGCAATGAAPNPLMEYPNEHFYAADGTFDAEAAKAAYYEMMQRFGYPIPERLRGEDFWTLDFGLGQFTEAGMAGVFWINETEHDYMGHEIFLLPGQMIPEHWHVSTDAVRAKVEGWHLRHGSVTLFAEGTPSAGVDEMIPPLHRDIAVARTATALKPGEYGTLANPGEKHWMRAGPEGAIVSEYASAHDMAGLRFTHPEIEL